MQPNKISILSTRPIDEQLIKNAAQKNIKIDIVSFIETAAIDDLEIINEIENALMQSATIVFTSMNAVDAVVVHLHDHAPDWRIYCIGNTTKKLVSEYFGESLITGTANNATELAEKIIEDSSTDEVIFFCGDKRRDELPGLLRENDIEVDEIEVYQTKMIQHTVTKNYNGILFFSPSAVESFFSNNKLNEQTILFAIGNTTANEIKKYSKNKIVISGNSGKTDLVETTINFFST
ncbi:MAG: uroporphyrinogen-III synthase [Parafilimonas sp.]|nr:uroporphyrinogen-III synthase [Parafilimonas sp.]